MNISIPPVAIGLIIIVVSNFLISFGESNVMKKKLYCCFVNSFRYGDIGDYNNKTYINFEII
jgi:hypothetical protein